MAKKRGANMLARAVVKGLNEWDIYVNFLHPTGLSTTIYWPAHRKCWVSLAHILSFIPQPNLAELLGICAVNTNCTISNIEQQKT